MYSTIHTIAIKTFEKKINILKHDEKNHQIPRSGDNVWVTDEFIK